MAVRGRRLSDAPMFRALPPEALAELEQTVRPRRFAAGKVIFREGDPADAMYVVASGSVNVRIAAETEPLAVLGPGNFVGELAVLLGEPRSATLEAATPARLWALSRDDLEGLLARYPTMALELSTELSRRLVRTTQRLSTETRTRVVPVVGGDPVRLAGAVAGLGLRVGAPGAAATDGTAGVDVVIAPLDDGHTELNRELLRKASDVVAFESPPSWVTNRLGGARLLQPKAQTGDEIDRLARRITGRAVGLALSSGGSKTIAHVGVLRVLIDRGVPIDAVAGSSGGALVAAALAAGMSVEQMSERLHELARLMRFSRLDMNLVPRSGLMKGRRLRELFDRWLEGRTFADLQVPLYLVATDFASGDEVVISDGPVADAVRASMSVPAVFEPWKAGERYLIDGAVVDPLPVGPLRAAGFERVIGSNVAGQAGERDEAGRAPHIIQIVLRVINLMEREVIKAGLPLADVVIRPVVTAANTFDFSRVDDFMAEGEAAARRELAAVDRLIGRASRRSSGRRRATGAPSRSAGARSSPARRAAERGTRAR